MDSCIFCRIASGEIPSNKVYETEDVFAFRDLSPQAPDHILIVPKRHIEKLADTNESDAEIMGKLMLAVSHIAFDLKLDEKGFRVVINNGETAGQSVWHLHVHLLSGRSFGWPPG